MPFFSQQYVSTNVTMIFLVFDTPNTLFPVYLQAITHIGLFTCTDKPILALFAIHAFCHWDVAL